MCIYPLYIVTYFFRVMEMSFEFPTDAKDTRLKMSEVFNNDDPEK